MRGEDPSSTQWSAVLASKLFLRVCCPCPLAHKVLGPLSDRSPLLPHRHTLPPGLGFKGKPQGAVKRLPQGFLGVRAALFQSCGVPCGQWLPPDSGDRADGSHPPHYSSRGLWDQCKVILRTSTGEESADTQQHQNLVCSSSNEMAGALVAAGSAEPSWLAKTVRSSL